MKYMCVQPALKYYAWQTEVMINNFKKNRIEDINIICSLSKTMSIPEEWGRLKTKYDDVSFFFYEDTRKNSSYISSIRPHVLKKHFLQHPELFCETIFYHDCDMVFTKPPNFSKFIHDDVWYMSDTIFYVGAEYVKSKKFGIYERMCEIIGIDQFIPEQNQLNTGGAQYIMKNVEHHYWEKVEKDSESLYKFFLEHLAEHPETSEYHPIQKWTADMWAVLWNAWYFGHETKVHDDLSFIWPTEDITNTKTRSILHNSGVADGNQRMFFKGSFINDLPYNEVLDINDKKASILYWNEVCETAKNSCLL